MNNEGKLVLFVVLFAVVSVADFIAITSVINKPVGLIPNSEKCTIAKFDFTSSNTATVTIYIPKDNRANSVTIFSANITGQLTTWKPTEGSNVTISEGASASFMVILEDKSQFIAGQEYHFIFYTTRGTTFVWAATYDPTS